MIKAGRYTARLPNRAERERNDVWWLEKDESNVREVVEDLVRQVEKHVPDYLKNGLELAYREDRDFFPPDEENMRQHIGRASNEGALYWIEKMIKFSGYMEQQEDEKIYKKLLEIINKK